MIHLNLLSNNLSYCSAQNNTDRETGCPWQQKRLRMHQQSNLLRRYRRLVNNSSKHSQRNVLWRKQSPLMTQSIAIGWNCLMTQRQKRKVRRSSSWYNWKVTSSCSHDSTLADNRGIAIWKTSFSMRTKHGL